VYIDYAKKLIVHDIIGCTFDPGHGDFIAIKREDITDIEMQTFQHLIPRRNTAERLHAAAAEMLKTPEGRKFVSTRYFKSFDDIYIFLLDNPHYIYSATFRWFNPACLSYLGVASPQFLASTSGLTAEMPSPVLMKLIDRHYPTEWVAASTSASTSTLVTATSQSSDSASIPIFYINMDSDTKRREKLEKDAHQRGLILTRVPAITPSTLSHVSNDVLPEGAPRNEQIDLSLVASHLVALKAFLLDTTAPVALILEDDVCLDAMDKWSFTLDHLKSELPEDCGILQLVVLWSFTQSGNQIILKGQPGHQLRVREPFNWCTGAYVIRREHAQKIVDYYEMSFDKEMSSDKGNTLFSIGRYPGRISADVLLYDDSVYRSNYRTYSLPLMYCTGISESTPSSFDRQDSLYLPGTQATMHNISRNYVISLLKDGVNLENLKLKDKIPLQQYPRVSIITPTYNRARFLPLLEERILQQQYPRHLIEWIIVDDSTDGSAEFVPRPNTGLVVHYERLQERMVLGAKRNYTARKATGDILVHMDDDDYYPPTRVALAVDALNRNPEVLLAGATVLPIYYINNEELWLAGPYSQNHSTAGAWAYRRILLETQKHDPTKAFAEEASFLDNFTIPMQQMNHYQTMVCFAHQQNTFDKSVLRDRAIDKTMKHMNPAKEAVETIIPPEILEQYLDFHRNKTNT